MNLILGAKREIMTEFMDAVVTTANENEPLALMTIPVPEMA